MLSKQRKRSRSTEGALSRGFQSEDRTVFLSFFLPFVHDSKELFTQVELRACLPEEKTLYGVRRGTKGAGRYEFPQPIGSRLIYIPRVSVSRKV